MATEREQELEKENAELREQLRMLTMTVNALKARLFGSRTSEKLDPGQLELLLGDFSTDQEEASEEAPLEEVKPHKWRKKSSGKPTVPDNVPVEERIEDPLEVQANPAAYRQIGQEVSEQLDYVPGHFILKRLVRRTWVLRDDPDATPLTAPLFKLWDRGFLAPGLQAQLIISKYVDHLPLYRQEKIFRDRYGVHIPRQTMCRNVMKLADTLAPIVDEMQREIFASAYVQADETPVKYLQPGTGSAKKGYAWVFNAPELDTVFRWGPGRGSEVLQEHVPEHFVGVLQSDFWVAYTTFAEGRDHVELQACWAHVRRRFFEALEGKEAVKRSGWIIHQIGLLYAIESRLRESRAGPSLREAVRQSESLPIIRRLTSCFKKLLVSTKHRPTSLMGKALAYGYKLRDRLDGYTDDGAYEIDNNLAENAVRPLGLGRKNWMFFGSEAAGHQSAILYSLVYSCQKRGIEPYAYLKDVLTRLATISKDELKNLTPRRWAEARATEELKKLA